MMELVLRAYDYEIEIALCYQFINSLWETRYYKKRKKPLSKSILVEHENGPQIHLQRIYSFFSNNSLEHIKMLIIQANMPLSLKLLTFFPMGFRF